MEVPALNAVARLPGRMIRSVIARTRDAWLTLGHVRAARRLVAASRSCRTHADLFDAVAAVRQFRPAQVRSEFVRLMDRVAAASPRAICEIGMATGGTAFLFARIAAPDAVLVTLDCIYHPPRRAGVRRFARPGQAIHCPRGDSHEAATREAAGALLGARPLDLLFIDGDHSYEGVRKDFEMYSPLLRPGGILAFHDIVLDYRTRTGRDTGTYTGGVPAFWKELRGRFPMAQEIIEDPGQDGFGIGVLEWPALPPP